MRYVNPLVEGSSPSPVTRDRNRQQTPNTAGINGLQQAIPIGIKGRSRQQPPISAPICPQSATQNATHSVTDPTHALIVRSPEIPSDPDLAEVAGAWGSLPAPIKAAVLALVRTASGKSSGR